MCSIDLTRFRLPKTITVGQYLLGTISFSNDPLARKVVSTASLRVLSFILAVMLHPFFCWIGLLYSEIYSLGNT